MEEGLMTKNLNGKDGMTRRGLLKSGMAMTAAGLMLPAGMAMAQAKPKKGGILRIGFNSGSTKDNYDPGVWDSNFTQVFAHARHNYLTEIAADGSLVGEVAESWEPSADAKTWILKIRKGITFHSGGTLGADDVIASINYHRGKDSTSAAKPIVDPIVEIKSDGPNKVVVTLSGGNADFPYLLSDYHLPIMPAKDGKINPASSDGCGPYKVDKFEPGVSATLSKHKGYWKSDRGHFDGLLMLALPDPVARQNALLTGQVDVINQLDLSTVAMMARNSSIRVLSVTGNQHFCFPMDTRTGPFNDNNVRLALKHALDRQEMVDKILYGYGSVGNDNPIGPSQKYHAADLPVNKYDPDKAKFYLGKAGLTSLDVPLWVAEGAFTGATDSGSLYAERAAAAGIKITVERAPNDGYWSNIWMKKPWCASYWGGRATCDWMFSTAYAAGAPWNESFWKHDQFNTLLARGRSELDDTKRAAIYHEMQAIVSNEGGVVIPMFASFVMGVTRAVATPDVVGANWDLDGFRAVERWWFA
jgi:peptide/nickel transport system substrate-binding protein